MTWKTDAEKHAQECLPDESCGLLAIIKGEETYWPCKNISVENFEYFIIDPDDWAKCEDTGEIIGLIHSHPTGSIFPSETDKASCEFLGLKWHIYSPLMKDWYSFEPTGWKPESLYGREWVWGIQDCWSLVMDFYRDKLNLKFKKWSRPKTIKEFAIKPYFDKALLSMGFKLVDNIQENDILVMEGAYQKLNHVALYIGDQTILHHVIGKLSCREIYDLKYQQVTKQIYRYDP